MKCAPQDIEQSLWHRWRVLACEPCGPLAKATGAVEALFFFIFFIFCRRRVDNPLGWTNPFGLIETPGKTPVVPHVVAQVDSTFDFWRRNWGSISRLLSLKERNRRGPDHSAKPLGLLKLYWPHAIEQHNCSSMFSSFPMYFLRTTLELFPRVQTSILWKSIMSWSGVRVLETPVVTSLTATPSPSHNQKWRMLVGQPRERERGYSPTSGLRTACTFKLYRTTWLLGPLWSV